MFGVVTYSGRCGGMGPPGMFSGVSPDATAGIPRDGLVFGLESGDVMTTGMACCGMMVAWDAALSVETCEMRDPVVNTGTLDMCAVGEAGTGVPLPLATELPVPFLSTTWPFANPFASGLVGVACSSGHTLLLTG